MASWFNFNSNCVEPSPGAGGLILIDPRTGPISSPSTFIALSHTARHSLATKCGTCSERKGGEKTLSEKMTRRGTGNEIRSFVKMGSFQCRRIQWDIPPSPARFYARHYLYL